MKIALATDHGGYRLKEYIKKYLEKKNHKVVDFGSNTPKAVDYPDYGFPAAESVGTGECDRGILLCRNGVGMSILANRVDNVRAALCLNPKMAQMSRSHNNANVLCLAGMFLDEKETKRILDVWLKTKFKGGRHKRRMDKIMNHRRG